jgi:hypothetical protein
MRPPELSPNASGPNGETSPERNGVMMPSGGVGHRLAPRPLIHPDLSHYRDQGKCKVDAVNDLWQVPAPPTS